MKIVLSNQSELPIYAQIREQIAQQILNGQLAAGTVLPSIRQLARDLGISVITTTRAYRELENSGFIASVQGKGSIVLERDNALIREQYQKQLKEYLEGAIQAAGHLGMSEDEVAQALKHMWTQGKE
ncbi:MAG: GntR family transcriptional regulator [Eubacteriales bacterium]|nr:GntR family transcriptional regulator [Eubacteriales bacterium]